jgi:hypothetical protein
VRVSGAGARAVRRLLVGLSVVFDGAAVVLDDEAGELFCAVASVPDARLVADNCAHPNTVPSTVKPIKIPLAANAVACDLLVIVMVPK